MNPLLQELMKRFNQASTPLVSEASIKPYQDAIDTPSLERSPMEARLRGFGAGALEGMRQQTSPASLGATALSLVPGGAIGKMLGSGAKLAKTVAPSLATAGGIGAGLGGVGKSMQRLYTHGAPVVRGMEQSGAFNGNRTVGGLQRLSKVAAPGSEASSRIAPVMETLGEMHPDFTAVGGEGMYNAGKSGAAALADPAFQAYQRILASGGK